VTDRRSERHHAAEGVAEQDRALDPEHVTEAAHIVDPRVEVPALGPALVASPLAALVEEDELGDVGERREVVRQLRVVRAGPAVQADDDRPVAGLRPVVYELGPDNVEV
jgi:hypothetical protein